MTLRARALPSDRRLSETRFPALWPHVMQHDARHQGMPERVSAPLRVTSTVSSMTAVPTP
jgi:hypothetical protein